MTVVPHFTDKQTSLFSPRKSLMLPYRRALVPLSFPLQAENRFATFKGNTIIRASSGPAGAGAAGDHVAITLYAHETHDDHNRAGGHATKDVIILVHFFTFLKYGSNVPHWPLQKYSQP